MGSRGSGFALGKEAARDPATGAKYPDHNSMLFVALDLLCGKCYPETRTRLARFAIESTNEIFDPAAVDLREQTNAITEGPFHEDRVATEKSGTSGARGATPLPW
jgi:succinylarginine dihydrolase